MMGISAGRVNNPTTTGISIRIIGFHAYCDSLCCGPSKTNLSRFMLGAGGGEAIVAIPLLPLICAPSRQRVFRKKARLMKVNTAGLDISRGAF